MKFAKCADQTRKLSWSNQKGESTFWSLGIILKSCVAIKTNYFVCINVDSKLAEKLEYFSRLREAILQKKIRFYESFSQTGGGGLLVFILLFRNLKAQNGIFWARIGCFDVYDNDKYEVHSINLVEHLNFGWLW
jgi:hypothetical protein